MAKVFDGVSGVDISFEEKDLLRTGCDALVNPTGKTLDNKGVVSQALKAACPNFDLECRNYIARQQNQEIQLDDVVAIRDTEYGTIISVVSPKFSNYSDKDQLVVALSDVLFKAIKKADELKCKSIGIPTVGSGLSRIPLEDCARSYWSAKERCSHQHGENFQYLKKIVFVDIDAEKVKRFNEMMDIFSAQTREEPPMSTTSSTPFALMKDCAFCEDPGCRKCIPRSEVYPLPHGMIFCEDCLINLLESSRHRDVKPRQQPANGKLEERIYDNRHLPDYWQCGVLELKFSFPAGYQGAHHPHPGRPYASLDLTTYVPDNDKGRQLRDQIKRLFNNRLLFRFDWYYRSGLKVLLKLHPDINLKTDTSSSGPQNYVGMLREKLDDLEAEFNNLTLGDDRRRIPE